jgi:8-oxo-dGTP pyrophosphatase MutT (NUDIX family)
VFPKGHIKKGEKPADAAVREVHEESGFKASIQGTVGYTRYETDKETVYARFYLMKYMPETEKECVPETGETAEGRKFGWLKFEKCLDRLSFEDSRELLRIAERLLASSAESNSKDWFERLKELLS